MNKQASTFNFGLKLSVPSKSAMDLWSQVEVRGACVCVHTCARSSVYKRNGSDAPKKMVISEENVQNVIYSNSPHYCTRMAHLHVLDSDAAVILRTANVPQSSRRLRRYGVPTVWPSRIINDCFRSCLQMSTKYAF